MNIPDKQYFLNISETNKFYSLRGATNSNVF